MKVPNLEKLFSGICAVRFPILYIMFEHSELTTATKFFIHFNMGFSAGENSSVHKYKGFCIYIIEKV